ncbi:hypothetical protein SAY87_003679 [Trapa incisa]|uniref:Uncharacterized protein n=1 Tax=Trapa incisa TaxID=236973 RepID=A0AAN7KG53_9MYRT|nr:hypothetical protein SAY87_003679 [Trapa incisa]
MGISNHLINISAQFSPYLFANPPFHIFLSTKMSSLAENLVAVIPFPATSHARPLANLVLKLAAEAPRVHFSFLADPGYNDVLSGHSSADAPPANVKVFGAITWPWVNPMPG